MTTLDQAIQAAAEEIQVAYGHFIPNESSRTSLALVAILKRHLAPILAPPPGKLARRTARAFLEKWAAVICIEDVDEVAREVERAFQAAREEERTKMDVVQRQSLVTIAENVRLAAEHTQCHAWNNDLVSERIVDRKERDRLSRQVEELKGALQPFALAAEAIGLTQQADTRRICLVMDSACPVPLSRAHFNVSDLRRARKALSEPKP